MPAGAGIKVSRPWLTQLTQATVALLEPIYDAQLASIRASRVKAMDEVPIKAGLSGPGKMKTTYFWPIYGERDEVCFTHSPGRSGQHVRDMLGLSPPDGAVLLSDGYAVYASYAKQVGLTHAQCWAHARREVFEAKDIEPAHAERALAHIAALYAAEEHIGQHGLQGAAKLAWRKASCPAAPSQRRSTISASAAMACACTSTMPPCRSTPTTSNGRCA